MAEEIFHIDPEVLASIHDFDWAIRSLALGEYLGRKQSKRLGVGMEFSQYRPYSQGDDLRQLDWKMYARTDKFYIRQSEIETNIDATFIIDNSKSMLYEESGWSKLNEAKLLCGVLGYVAMENGDWIGLADEVSMKSGNDARHWMRYLNRLHLIEAVENFQLPFIENRKSKELFVVVSDLYDDNDDMLPFIHTLKTPGNEVIVFHLMGKKEESLDFGSGAKMKDLETGATVQLNPEAYQRTYKRRIKEWKKELAHDFLIRGIDYHVVDFTKPVAMLINAFLNRRKQLL
ncbi:MAG: DUF58 domain-containing protein [Cyclobacteriaceae bacterium]